MEVYIIDFYTLEIKDIIMCKSPDINIDDETNAKTQIKLFKNPNAKHNDYIIVKDKIVRFKGQIDEILGTKNSTEIILTALDISNIFDRKVYEKNMDLLEISVEDFIYQNIIDFFKNTGDSMIDIPYLEVVQKTSTLAKQSTDSQDGIYNFHTFISNVKQNYDIFIDFEIQKDKIIVSIENKTLNKITIDTTVAEITDYKKVYEVDPITKVTVKCGDTNNVLNWYLKTDRTVTDNKDDSNRAYGKIETIYIDSESKAYDSALNIFKGNRYNHLIQFNINKNSKLVDVNSLTTGTPVKIKTNDGIFESYISAIAITEESNFISYKTGQIRISLLDKLKKSNKTQANNKLDKAGGNIYGDLNLIGGILKINGAEVKANGGDTVPIGAGMWYPSDIIPDNWLLCNGQAVSRTTYNLLFAVMGTLHGSGDGSTTFNLPDIKGRTIIGKNSGDTGFDVIGEKIGNATHILTPANMPGGMMKDSGGPGWGSAILQNSGYTATTVGDNSPISNFQPSIAENYIIKAKYSDGILPEAGLVLDGFGNASTINAGSANNDKILYETKADKVNMAKYIVHRRPIFGIGGDAAKNNDKNTWVDLTGDDVYNPYLYGISQIPVPNGYTRYVRAYAVYCDNVNQGLYGLLIKTMNSGLDRNYFRFDKSWGSPTARRDMYNSEFILFSNLFNGHVRFYSVIPGEAQAGATGKLYYLELVYYDVPNGIVPV